MHPILFDTVPAYFVMWGVAGVLCVATGTHLAVRAGFPAPRSAATLALLALAIMGGAKLMYILETSFFPSDDYVPLSARGTLHGFRIPGGIAVLVVATPLICNAFRLPWREFGDLQAPVAALSLVLIRIGCFLNGCCFGKVAGLPWALTFPQGSPVFLYHQSQHYVVAGSPRSLPVHPLQLYFAAAALVSVGALWWIRKRQLQQGFVQLAFYVLFFATTAFLEPFRANHLTLNNWVVATATVVACGILLFGRITVRLPLATELDK